MAEIVYVPVISVITSILHLATDSAASDVLTLSARYSFNWLWHAIGGTWPVDEHSLELAAVIAVTVV